jgi:hypothetical protein
VESLDNEHKIPLLFNGTLETGVRLLIVLNALYPRALSLTHLIWFDHLVVHTNDFGGPESLHPPLPYRSGEILVRRRLIEDSLNMMRMIGYVDIVSREDGIYYVATEDAYPFINLLSSEYLISLKGCAKWVSEKFGGLMEEEIRGFIAEKAGRWNIEFQDGIATGSW